MNNYNVFQELVHNHVDEICISEDIIVTDKIKKQHKGFESKEKIAVKVMVKKDFSTEWLVELLYAS